MANRKQIFYYLAQRDVYVSVKWSNKVYVLRQPWVMSSRRVFSVLPESKEFLQLTRVVMVTVGFDPIMSHVMCQREGGTTTEFVRQSQLPSMDFHC